MFISVMTQRGSESLRARLLSITAFAFTKTFDRHVKVAYLVRTEWL